MAKRFKVTARILPDSMPFTLRGQEALTLVTLNNLRNQGVTVFDFQGGVGYRLAAYIHTLAKRRFLNIEMMREKHDGGWHGRWFLKSQIEIISVDDPNAPPAQRRRKPPKPRANC
jgi:hypothetical protein